MPTKKNDLFIGSDLIACEGAGIKHAGTMKEYGLINANKLKVKPKEFNGIDIETDTETGNIKLLGIWNGQTYNYYYDTDFVMVVYRLVRDSFFAGKNIVYWRKLDPFTMYKDMLFALENDDRRIESLSRFGKISGSYNKKEMKFNDKKPPVISLKLDNDSEFGILSVIRSSLQFYFISANGFMGTVWAYDESVLYENSLTIEAGLHLPYYSKIDVSAHIVDWKKFDEDKGYREDIVLKSNEFDCRAVYDLSKLSDEGFAKAFFGYYPTSHISAGAFARSAIVAVITHEFCNIEDEKERRKKISEELNSIGICNYTDEWCNKYGIENYKNMMCLFSEAYSGAYIETYGYGYIEKCLMADISGDYPDKIQKMWDLRECKITFGKGEPPDIPFSYCFIRGEVASPNTINFNPITTKHPIFNRLNIHSNGFYKASYFKGERDYLIQRGGQFYNEEWVNIETTGKPSVLSKVSKKFSDIRDYLLSIHDSAQDRAKKSNNSCYGLAMQSTEIYELINGKVENVGLRAGEFYNPITAGYITSQARIQICENAEAVERNGGKVLTIMTDSIFYDGTIEMLPPESWKKKKTLGYFEEPEELHDFICLGAGRYEYNKYNKETKKFDRFKNKARGFSMADVLSDNGIEMEKFNWRKALKQANRNNSLKINMNVRVLVSVGLVLNNKKYPLHTLGKIVEENRIVDIIAGKEKRIIEEKTENLIKKMQNGMVFTAPHYWEKDCFVGYDMTLPYLRKHLFDLDVLSPSQKTRGKNTNKNKRKWQNIKDEYMKKYYYCKEHGLDGKTANRYAKMNWNKIYIKLGGIKNDN